MPGFSSEAAAKISDTVKFFEQFNNSTPQNTTSHIIYEDDHCDIVVQNMTGEDLTTYQVARLGDPTFAINGEEVNDVDVDQLIRPTFEIVAPLGYGFDDVIVSLLEDIPDGELGLGRISGLVYCYVGFNYDFWTENASPTYSVGMDIDVYNHVVTEHNGARIAYIYGIDGDPWDTEVPETDDVKYYWCLLDLRGQQSD